MAGQLYRVKTDALPRLVMGTTLRLPLFEDDCAALLRRGPLPFWAVTMYTASYDHKVQRLLASCETWVCTPPYIRSMPSPWPSPWHPGPSQP